MADDPSKALNDQIEAIKAKYAPQIKALQDEGQSIKDDTDDPDAFGATIGIDFKVDWKDEEIIFDVPSVTIENKDISFDLPEITSVRQHIAFDIPAVRMVDKKVGQYPEVINFTVRWHDIIISVPETYMQRQDIYYDIPSVTMKTQHFVVGIPTFTMQRVRWVIGLPQFTVINVKGNIQSAKDRGSALQSKGQALAASMKAEIQHAVDLFKQQLANSAGSTGNAISKPFDAALTTITSAINDLQAKGCDPIKVPTDSGTVNLRKMYADTATAKAAAMATFGETAASAALPTI
ncbi:hypothetical protein EI171_08355 [Bradyrhizobium sp. LCT2]|uniref:hypothetical protein n=1 Tax=Bradyrhizobium sp. LCT2 TaxID=2493093 RepID=UPI0013741FEE|nr:hypothetical protein [Bradyrhizobium sp. LCT2]QHP67438.1 hypothetical protein EI171_08355 [Bradyrhizobium sp. LCT2]